MYDKKTWIVVTLCSVLLAGNFYFMDKQNRAKVAANAELQNQEKFNRKAVEAAKPPVATPATGTATETVPVAPVTVEEKLVVLETNRVKFSLTNIGGGIKTASLKSDFEIGPGKIPIEINARSSNPVAGLTAGIDAVDKLVYNYMADKSEIGKSVVFIATTPEGMIIKKTYRLLADLKQPGAPYMLDFDLTFENTSATPININQWNLSIGSAAPLHSKEWPNQTTFFFHDDGAYDFVDVTTFKGGWFSKEKMNDPRSLKQAELAGVCDQFFSIAVKAREPYQGTVTAKPFDINFPDDQKPHKAITAQVSLPSAALAQGEIKKVSYQIFMGPKDNNMLRKMGGDWGDIMNYGWLWWISRPLNWLLHAIHFVVGKVSTTWSWGISIVLLTLVVRTAIWPLYNKSNRSMKRMAKLKPEMDRLKEKYKDDPTKMNQETMRMYKKYGVNPIGGCLPMLLQMPIFFGFYRMLQYCVELRHQPFLGWVHDLSQPDTIGHIMGYPINLLPIVMTLSSFAQMAMMPKTGDKMQQRMMMFMPFVFLIFCYSFASALALYWTTQNLFTIFQTWLTSKLPEPQLKERPINLDAKPKKKTFMERMMEKQEELQRAQAERAKNGGNDPSLRDVTPSKKRPPKTGG
jgi:YidC/Oxa1 family membrane protein insertase